MTTERYVPKLRHYAGNCMAGLRKTKVILTEISRIRAEIGTQDSPNMKQNSDISLVPFSFGVQETVRPGGRLL
jgi:hypothetical protein